MKKLFTLIAVAVMAFAAQANELTVCDQNENAYAYVPVYGYWFDAEGITQMIYPAEMLTDMAGGEITAVKFYTAATWGEGFEDYTIAFSGADIVLAFKEVNQTAFVTPDPMIAGATVVAVTVAEEGGLYLTFELDEPFEYNGGNLLVEAYWDGTGTWGRTYFVGQMFDYNCCYYAYEYYDGMNENLGQVLPMATFTYDEGTTPPPTPTEKTGAPTFNGYTTDGIHAYFVELLESEPSTIYYRVQYGIEGEFTEWAEYEDLLSFTEDGWYRVEAYALADGKLPSDPIAYEFVVSPVTGLSEMLNGKTVAGVRYFNMAGQEMQEANGVTIVVTTYTDGTTNSVKVMK